MAAVFKKLKTLKKETITRNAFVCRAYQPARKGAEALGADTGTAKEVGRIHGSTASAMYDAM